MGVSIADNVLIKACSVMASTLDFLSGSSGSNPGRAIKQWRKYVKLIPMKNGDEFDALTHWKNYLHWKPGQRKRIKRMYNKRVRRIFKSKDARVAQW